MTKAMLQWEKDRSEGLITNCSHFKTDQGNDAGKAGKVILPDGVFPGVLQRELGPHLWIHNARVSFGLSPLDRWLGYWKTR